MDFEDSPAEAIFRRQVREWLLENAEDYAAAPAVPYSEDVFVESARAWQRRKANAGYAGIGWPTSAGGRGATVVEEIIFDEEERRFYVPKGPFISIGISLAVPTIRARGSSEQAERFTRPTLQGELTWCQLFSEPSAGSDLAALRTRAVLEGNQWIVNGQKVWTSWAHHAQFGILLARTDPTVPKHKGLTFFVVDMKSPGITIRPIRQISGKSDFNEVFLENVAVPDGNRIGAAGDGWACAMTTLSTERITTGTAGENDFTVAQLLHALPGALRDFSDSRMRQAVARWWVQEQGLRYFRFRMRTQLSKGKPLGAETALSKLVYARKLQEISAFAMDLDGLAGLFVDDRRPHRAAAFESFLWSGGIRVAGGADEVLRNQIAERVLGLPGEPRLDRNVPFNALI